MKLQLQKNHYSDWLKYVTPFGLIFILFLASRLAFLQKVVLLEDMDSVSYLRSIQTFLSFNFEKIYTLDPDSSIFYSALGALFSLPSWSIETGARLASLFSQFILFFSIIGIGLRLGSYTGTIVGLLLFTFTPALVELSVAVLTEPTYVSLIYLSLLLLWTQFKKPSLWKAAAIGALIGLAFLTRLEGVIYLAVFPAFFLGYFVWQRPQRSVIKKYTQWVLAFWFTASLFIIPQIYRVSNEMDTLAVNGRQAWTLLLHSDEDKSFSELVFGLDYSSEKVNIEYLKENMDQFSNVETGSNNSPNLLKEYAVTLTLNFLDLNDSKFPKFLGLFVIIFFSFGLFSLFKKGYTFEIFLIILFLVASLVPPMLHNVIIRHILVVGPLILLIAGLGIVFISRSIRQNIKSSNFQNYLILPVLILITISPWIYPLKNGYNPPTSNNNYNIEQLQDQVAVIKEVTQKELDHKPVIATRLTYISYYADGKTVLLPYTDYDGLVEYLSLNNADFLFLNYHFNYKKNRKYPFMTKFIEGDISDNFELLYEDHDNHTGAKLELYRFKNAKSFTDTRAKTE